MELLTHEKDTLRSVAAGPAGKEFHRLLVRLIDDETSIDSIPEGKDANAEVAGRRLFKQMLDEFLKAMRPTPDVLRVPVGTDDFS